MTESYIDPAILPKGSIMVIAGDTRAECSLLAWQTTFELATGRRWLNLFPTIQATVLYLDLDKHMLITRDQYHNQSWIEEYTSAGANVKHCDDSIVSLDTDRGAANLERMINESCTRVVVVDPFCNTIKTLGLVSMKKALRNCRELAVKHDVAFILLHDLVKRPPVPKNLPRQSHRSPIHLAHLRGSGILADWVDTVVVVDNIGDQRELSFLKHSLCPIPLVEQSKPLIFDFRPSSAVPYQPTRGTRTLLSKNVRHSLL